MWEDIDEVHEVKINLTVACAPLFGIRACVRACVHACMRVYLPRTYQSESRRSWILRERPHAPGEPLAPRPLLHLARVVGRLERPREQFDRRLVLADGLEELPAARRHVLLINLPVLQLASHDRAAHVVREVQRLVAVEVENGSKDDRVAVEEVLAATLAIIRRVRTKIRQHRSRTFLKGVDESLKARPSDVDDYRLPGGCLLFLPQRFNQTLHVHLLSDSNHDNDRVCLYHSNTSMWCVTVVSYDVYNKVHSAQY